ncbi:hypothetical protein IO99_00505 [Clostridium sulfidigenes]|uniref:DUF4935 domain-containing protein n=1 Tax=Clostridium sulfidigenes TaxID=318464 RepID=A0A084JIB2_9CLOT|nr:PIN domain-containing protein [Clostridium sulfidigenes]KEZ88696.1 hypothetical protein IO99_00505 [Clostridium sulfidigenes]
MYYLIIDTCVWLNIGKDIINTEVIDQLTNFVKSDKVRIILPDIVKNEWDKHKQDKIIDLNKKSVQGKLKNVKELLVLVEEDKQKIIEDLLKSKVEVENEVEKKAKELIRKIEALFSYPTTKRICPNKEVATEVVEWGLMKKAPHHKKSSMADTLLLLNSIYYIKKHSLRNVIFVTANKEDFSSISNPKIIHEDLKMKFEENKISYFINIGEALNKIERDAISDEVVNKIEKLSDIMICYRCGGNMDDGAYKMSQYGGLTFQYTCCACGARFDTGEYFD